MPTMGYIIYTIFKIIRIFLFFYESMNENRKQSSRGDTLNARVRSLDKTVRNLIKLTFRTHHDEQHFYFAKHNIFSLTVFKIKLN